MPPLDPTTVLTVKQILIGFAAITFLGAIASALKVYIDTQSKAKALLAFVTSLLSVAHFFQPRQPALEEKAPPPPLGFARLPLLVLLALVALLASSCAWLKTEAPLVAGDVIHCASETAVTAVGPLAATLAEAAVHGGEADWDAELTRLVGSAKEFRDCVILAALNRVASDPLHAPSPVPTEAVAARFRPLRAIDEVHAAAAVEQAKMRLRAALK